MDPTLPADLHDPEPGAEGPRAAGRVARALRVLALATLAAAAGAPRAEEPSEYKLKAAFVYNFALFTEWPADLGATLTLCVLAPDPFGREIDALQGKPVGARTVAVQRKAAPSALAGCQIAFVPAPAMAALPRVLETLQGTHALTVADSPGAARQGVALNMAVAQGRVTFEANLGAARAAGLNLSSKLLRLATEVHQ